MNDKLCVFGAYPYTDIDALACAVAYAELNNCIAYLPGPLNATVPDSVRNWGLKYTTKLPKSADEFVMIDFSNPEFIPADVPLDKVTKVYDHHTGFEKYWGKRGQIEFIGACATQIYELFGNSAPSATTANLLKTAIFANTLNFNSDITTQRDRNAYKKLDKYSTLPKDWMAQYYSAVEKFMLADIRDAIVGDLKIMDGALAVGQLELWDAKELLNDAKFVAVLNSVMSEYKDWFMTMPSISEGKNYLITNNDNLKRALTAKFAARWNGITPQLYLRKEFKKAFKWR